MDATFGPVCPACRGSIEASERGSWACRSCLGRFGGLRGIPDLRTAEDGYMPNAEDLAFARTLDDAFDRLDARGMLGRYYDTAGDIDAARRRVQVDHILSAPARARTWLDAIGPIGEGAVLDLGCGGGSFLAAAAGGGPDRDWIGVDIAMRWLIVARKRLDEAGLDRVALACGCAEDLPIADESCAAVVAGDAIEHVADQGATLAEAFRVLRPGGRLFLASPNRFSLAPEPHVGVWGVGYLPRKLMTPYVKRTSGRDFRAIRTLGCGEWKRLLAGSPFGGGSIVAPGLPKDEVSAFGPFKRPLGLAYNAAVSSRVGQAAARRVGPLFHVVCTKPGRPAARASSPAIRPRSTPPATQA